MSKPKIIFNYPNHSKDHLPHDIALSEENIASQLEPLFDLSLNISQIYIDVLVDKNHANEPFICKIKIDGPNNFNYVSNHEGDSYETIMHKSIRDAINYCHQENDKLTDHHS